MSTAKAFLGAVAGRFLFRNARVAQVERVGPFTHLEVEGEALRDAPFTPGCKVQVFFPGVGMRTYTPLEWNGGRTAFLGFQHGGGPGSAWLGSVQVGDAVQLFGPRASLDVRGVAGPLVVVGDETSLALGLALQRAEGSARPVHAVLEARDVAAVQAACARWNLAADVVPRDGLFPALCARLDAGATPVFSGRAATLQQLKRALKESRRSASGPTKAYWAEGKRGLD